MTREEIKKAFDNKEAVIIDSHFGAGSRTVYITEIINDNEIMIGNAPDAKYQASTRTYMHRLHK